jgi:outer membrane protein OmpA-like peptidoglycan-associated protein
MNIRNHIFRLPLFVIVACWVGVSAAQADCGNLLNRFNAALSARKLPDVEDLDAKIANDGSCGEPEINRAHRAKAALQFELVKSLIKKGSPPSDYEKLLSDASNVAWDAAAALGNIKSAQRQFVEATIAYDRALELVKNASLTPAAPPKSMIEEIYNSASESRLLAANEEGGDAIYVAAAKDHRDGTVGGAMSENIRGFTPKAVPIPIGFETASAKFTTIGQRAASELLLALQQQQPVSVTLVGHTDERGDDAYNLRLSDERVKAVALFLKQNGIAAKIATVAKGKTEPLALNSASQYTREEIWALNRRVEWRRQ